MIYMSPMFWCTYQLLADIAEIEKEAEAAFALPPGVHSYALLPIGYPIGRFGPVRRVPLPMSSMKIGGASLTEIRVGQSIA